MLVIHYSDYREGSDSSCDVCAEVEISRKIGREIREVSEIGLER